MWQRISAAGGGLLFGDAGVAALGGTAGQCKDLANEMAIRIGAYIGLSMFGFLNYDTTFLGIEAVLVNNLVYIYGVNKSDNKVKEALITRTRKQIDEPVCEQTTEKMMKTVRAKVLKIVDTVLNFMDSDINEVELLTKDNFNN